MAKEKVIDLKPKAEKVTEIELKDLQQIVKTVNALQFEIGKVEAQKHTYLHKLATVQDKITLMQEEFEKVYGTANINISDGTINHEKNE